MKRIVLPFLLCIAVTTSISSRTQKFNALSDTSFLSKSAQTRHFLCTLGFQEVRFTSHDGVELAGLFFQQDNAIGTIISVPGFFPGVKEGMSTLFNLIPDNYNLLLIEHRGHGQSKGRFFSSLHSYGLVEYNDVIGACKFVSDQTNKPIVIHGICSGAFHAVHALNYMTKHHINYKVQGLVFDSGWASVLDSSLVPLIHCGTQSPLRDCLLIAYRNKNRTTIRKTYAFRCLNYALGCVMKSLRLLYLPALKKNEPHTSIFGRMRDLSVPVLFIHSHDDAYVSIKSTQELAEQTRIAHTWWIEKPSSHTVHHLKHAQEYEQQLTLFLEQCRLTS